MYSLPTLDEPSSTSFWERGSFRESVHWWKTCGTSFNDETTYNDFVIPLLTTMKFILIRQETYGAGMFRGTVDNYPREMSQTDMRRSLNSNRPVKIARPNRFSRSTKDEYFDEPVLDEILWRNNFHSCDCGVVFVSILLRTFSFIPSGGVSKRNTTNSGRQLPSGLYRVPFRVFIC